MNEKLNIFLWIFFCWMFTASSIQDQDYMDSESTAPEFIKLIDGQPLILNSSFCLERITAKALSSSFYGDHNRSSYYIRITWESKSFMSSIKVESGSLNDSYCEAKNKHYYYRKPLNQSVHVFPDEVHEGIRFLPIKLDCEYVITPELDGVCRPLRLGYSTPVGVKGESSLENLYKIRQNNAPPRISTARGCRCFTRIIVAIAEHSGIFGFGGCDQGEINPVCIDKDTCTCRNVNMSGPNLEGELERTGINVFWSFPEGFSDNISSVVFSIYSEDGINAKKLLKRKMSATNFNSANVEAQKQRFQVNTTSESLYRVQVYFENKINCRGNSTFLLLRHSGNLKRLNYEIILYTMAFVFIFLFILVCLFSFWKKQVGRVCAKLFPSKSLEATAVRCRFKDQKLPFPGQCNPIYEEFRDPYLFDYRDLIIQKEIASGNFGVVYLAYSRVGLRGCHEVAIKQIKDMAGPEGVTDFLEEINVFKQVGEHPNVVKMFGYCSGPQPLTIIMEYVPFNLLTYLKNLRAEFEKKKSEPGGSVSYAELSCSRISGSTLSDDDYISQSEVECAPLNADCKPRELEYVLDNTELEIFGLQIARGMAHLESKDIVHRDLAVRNVLMDNAKVLKISDFGMSKTGIYVNKRSKKFPLRWMSPEALVNRIYSNKSDVWSFGVVLWEIGTLGAFPYPNLQNDEVISLLEKGGHLDRPENVTAQLYSIMSDCWARFPEDRPTFRELVERIESFCQKSNGYVDFGNLESNYSFPPMEEDVKRVKS